MYPGLTHSGTPHIFNGTMTFFSHQQRKKKLKPNQEHSTLSHAVYDLLYNSLNNYQLLPYLFEMIRIHCVFTIQLGFCGCVCIVFMYKYVCVCVFLFASFLFLDVGFVNKQISNAKWCFQFTLVFLDTHNFDND